MNKIIDVTLIKELGIEEFEKSLTEANIKFLIKDYMRLKEQNRELLGAGKFILNNLQKVKDEREDPHHYRVSRYFIGMLKDAIAKAEKI